jgi:hypothetical protein
MGSKVLRLISLSRPLSVCSRFAALRLAKTMDYADLLFLEPIDLALLGSARQVDKGDRLQGSAMP